MEVYELTSTRTVDPYQLFRFSFGYFMVLYQLLILSRVNKDTVKCEMRDVWVEES